MVDVAWTTAVGADFQSPQTSGPKPRGTDLFGRYLSRLTRKAHDGDLRDARFEVMLMEQPPTSLLRPGIARRVLEPDNPLGPPVTSLPTKLRRRRTS